MQIDRIPVPTAHKARPGRTGTPAWDRVRAELDAAYADGEAIRIHVNELPSSMATMRTTVTRHADRCGLRGHTQRFNGRWVVAWMEDA